MDDRFAAVFRDHRFRPIRPSQRKINIDKRFQGIFSKKNFQENITVDKRGRPVKESTSKRMRRFYRLTYAEKKRLHEERVLARQELKKRLEIIDPPADIDANGDREQNDVVSWDQKTEAASEVQNEPENNDDTAKHSEDESSDSSYFSSDDESDMDLARGKGNVESSSDEEDLESELNSDAPDHGWGEMDNEAPRSEATSRRLALCNMDWDRVRASDIFILLDSFKPTAGSILSVEIYPSEYGSKRMAEEEKSGPAEFKELKSENSGDDFNHEDENYNAEKLRQYQLNRLKYYYAVISCDSANTAEKIYQECDGLEYETSSSKLDLRFIPDEIQFTDFPAKDSATSLPDVTTYKPSPFVTAALNQTKVDLTWDETDHRRTALTKTKFTKEDLENMDVRDFLASSSGSESEEDATHEPLSRSEKNSYDNLNKLSEEERVKFYREALLGKNQEDEESDVDMEVTWEPDLKPAVEQGILMKNRKTEKKLKPKKSKEPTELEASNEAELEMVMLHDNIAGERSEKNSEDFEIDVNDERFYAVFKSSNFAIDRSNSLFKKSEAMEKLVQERQNRMKKLRQLDDQDLSKSNAVKKVDDEKESISQLVKSIKSKSARLAKKSTKKT